MGSLFTLFLLAPALFFSFLSGQASLIGGVAAYAIFIFSAVFSVFSVSPLRVKEKRAKNPLLCIIIFLLVVGVCLSGTSIAQTIGKTELKLYKASATPEHSTLNEYEKRNCTLTFLVINYGGSPANGEIKIFGYWNGTYTEIASTEKIEGFGYWKSSAILNFSPIKLILVYNSERVSEKEVYYRVPRECAILYPAIGILIVASAISLYRKK